MAKELARYEDNPLGPMTEEDRAELSKDIKRDIEIALQDTNRMKSDLGDNLGYYWKRIYELYFLAKAVEEGPKIGLDDITDGVSTSFYLFDDPNSPPTSLKLRYTDLAKVTTDLGRTGYASVPMELTFSGRQLSSILEEVLSTFPDRSILKSVLSKDSLIKDCESQEIKLIICIRWAQRIKISITFLFPSPLRMSISLLIRLTFSRSSFRRSDRIFKRCRLMKS